MKKYFFITGLPRSRTAWLANFFTYGNSFCYHEATRDCPSIAAMKTRFDATPAPYVGTSDSGLPVFMDEVMHAFPKSPLVIIERDVAEVIAGFNRAFPQLGDGTAPIHKLKEILAQIQARYPALMVPFAELNQVTTLRKVWNHCLGSIPFPQARWELLNPLIVEIHPQKYLTDFPTHAVTRFTEALKKITK